MLRVINFKQRNWSGLLNRGHPARWSGRLHISFQQDNRPVQIWWICRIMSGLQPHINLFRSEDLLVRCSVAQPKAGLEGQSTVFQLQKSLIVVFSLINYYIFLNENLCHKCLIYPFFLHKLFMNDKRKQTIKLQ